MVSASSSVSFATSGCASVPLGQRQVHERVDVARIELQRGAELCGGLVRPALQQQRHAVVVVRQDVAGLDEDRARQLAGGFRQQLLFLIEQAEIVVRLRVQLVPLQQRAVMLQGVLEVPGAMVIQRELEIVGLAGALAAAAGAPDSARVTGKGAGGRGAGSRGSPDATGARWRWKLRARRLGIGDPRACHSWRRLTGRAGRGRLRGGNRRRGQRRGRGRRRADPGRRGPGVSAARILRGGIRECSGRRRRHRRAEPPVVDLPAGPAQDASTAARIRIANDRGSRPDVAGTGAYRASRGRRPPAPCAASLPTSATGARAGANQRAGSLRYEMRVGVAGQLPYARLILPRLVEIGVRTDRDLVPGAAIGRFEAPRRARYPSARN